jgi:hypothetical protein
MGQIKQIAKIFFVVSGLLLAGLPSASLAQETITVVDQGWEATFRDNITFTLEATSEAEIVEIDLFYQIVGQIATSRNAVDFTPGTSVQTNFVIDQTDPSNYSPPGTELQYWWKIVDSAGNELKTEKETLLYIDTRHDWQTLENERLTLYWYNGDDSFGQSLFDRANEALDTLETDVGAVIEQPIKIFIYGGHEDLLGALQVSAQEWTGGVAFTEYGVVVIGIDPRQLDWGLNAMTHEMTHLIIHQKTVNPFGDLPRWLDEGIAVYNENQDELDDDFRAIFERAVEDNELMTLRTLSSPFPADPLQANLAYGQSGAVVKYIIDTYGSEKMANLLDIFSEGALYDEALEQALGVNTDMLDNEFRASVGLPPLPGTETDAAATVSEEAAPAEIEVTEAEENSERLPVVEEEIDTESAPDEGVSISGASSEASGQEATESKRAPFGLSCLTGLIPLFFLGLVISRRQGWVWQ